MHQRNLRSHALAFTGAAFALALLLVSLHIRAHESAAPTVAANLALADQQVDAATQRARTFCTATGETFEGVSYIDADFNGGPSSVQARCTNAGHRATVVAATTSDLVYGNGSIYHVAGNRVTPL